MSEKIEGVSKVSQAMKTQSSETMEQGSDEQFQKFMDSSSSIQTTFERLDAKNLAITPVDTHLDTQQTTRVDENVTSQNTGSATDQEQKRQQQNSESDETEGVSGVEGVQKKRKTSDVSEAGKISSGETGVSVDQLKKQTQEAVSKIEEAKSQLVQANQANLEIKPSYQKLLRNHLAHIDDNIKIASSKLGVESTPAAKVAETKATNPAERFLNMLTQSQSDLNRLNDSISAASTSQMSMGAMLALQYKTNMITQEVDLFTNLLSKALESVKTIMNVQV